MSVDNRSPFPALAFRQYSLTGTLNGVVVATGTFQLHADGSLTPLKNQPALQMADVYEGDPQSTDLLASTDLSPFKPGTDVTVLGSTYPDGDEQRESWTCEVRVAETAKTLRVYGPRYWRRETGRRSLWGLGRPQEDSWNLQEPEPIDHVPLSWRLAQGGRHFLDSGNKSCDLDNPIGTGIIPLDLPDDVETWPAARIEAEGVSTTDWRTPPPPAGFGPVSPFWLCRQRFAGTYDDNWLSNRHPLLPNDFDYRFWQSAPPELVTKQWLKGGEPFELRNLVWRLPLIRGHLPRAKMGVKLDRPGGRAVLARMELDTVHFDLRPGHGTLKLVWRTAFPWPDGKGRPALIMREKPELMTS